LIASLRKDLNTGERALHDRTIQAAELEQLLQEERRRLAEREKEGDLQVLLKLQLRAKEEEAQRLEEAVTEKENALASEALEARLLQLQLDETKSRENMHLQRYDEWRDRAQVAASRAETEEEIAARAKMWERAAQSEVKALKEELDEARCQADEKTQHRTSILDAVRAERDANQRTIEHLRHELINEQREALRHQQAAASRAEKGEEEVKRAEMWEAAARSELAALRAECDASQRTVEQLRYELIVEQQEARSDTAKLQQELLDAQQELLEAGGSNPVAISTLQAQRDLAQEEVTHYEAQRDLVQEEAERLQAALTEARDARDTEVDLVRRLQRFIEELQKNNKQPSLSLHEALALKDDVEKWRKIAEAAKDARDGAEREYQKALKLIRRYEEKGHDLNNSEVDLLRQECMDLLDACGQLLLRSQRFARNHDPRLGKQMDDLISHLGTRIDGFRSRRDETHTKHQVRPRQATTKRRSSQLSRGAVKGQLWDWMCRTTPPNQSREPQAHRQSSRTEQDGAATEHVFAPNLRNNASRSRRGQALAVAEPVVSAFRDGIPRT